MKSQYLQAMGIMRWRLRTRNPIAYYRLFLENGQCVGVLIAPMSANQYQQERQLLEAIIRALGLHAQETQSTGAEPGIALGAHPATVNTHSLADMLKTPSLKAPVWRALQDFFKIRKMAAQ